MGLGLTPCIGCFKSPWRVRSAVILGQFSKLQQQKEKLDNLPNATVVGGWNPSVTILCGEKIMRRSNIIAGFVCADVCSLLTLNVSCFDSVADVAVVSWQRNPTPSPKVENPAALLLGILLISSWCSPVCLLARLSSQHQKMSL